MLGNTSTNFVIRCTQCDLPIGRVVGDLFVINCRHHGEKHTQEISIRELAKLAKLDKKGVYVRDG